MFLGHETKIEWESKLSRNICQEPFKFLLHFVKDYALDWFDKFCPEITKCLENHDKCPCKGVKIHSFEFVFRKQKIMLTNKIASLNSGHCATKYYCWFHFYSMQYVSIKKLKVHSRDGGRSKNGRGAVS